MNSFKSQLNPLIFKILVLLLVCVLSKSAGSRDVLQYVSTRQFPDTNYLNTLYDSAKVYYRNANYDDAIQYFNKILSLKNKRTEDINPEYFKVYNWLV